MGRDKMLITVAGRPLLAYSVAAFDLCPDISEIVVVASQDNLTNLRETVPAPKKPIHWVVGGATRPESVLCGLRALDPGCNWAVVHDGARPLIRPDSISRCISEALTRGGATLAERVADTIQLANSGNCCAGIIDRDRLWRIQTPQVFQTQSLISAHEQAIADGVITTDETAVMLRVGVAAFLVENRDWNFKVTVPEDVPLAEFVLSSRSDSATNL